MKTTRYTEKSLVADLAALNTRLESSGAEYRFSHGGSYGRQDVDLATPEQLARRCCQRRLVSGTPRECIAAAREYVLASL